MYRRLFLPYAFVLISSVTINRFFVGQAQILIPLLFIYTAVGCIFFTRRPPATYGLSLKNWKASLWDVGWLSIVFLVPFAFLSQALFQYTGLINFHEFFSKSGFWGMILYQLVIVGPSEEVFFRGYIQRELWELPSKNCQSFNVKLMIIGCSSFLFMLMHWLNRPSWISLLIFFPGVLFAWLREKNESLLASSLFHGMCNVVYFWLFFA